MSGTIYIVTSGEYSDHRIRAVFDLERAQGTAAELGRSLETFSPGEAAEPGPASPPPEEGPSTPPPATSGD